MWYIGQSLIAIDYKGIRLEWAASPAHDLDGYHVYMREGEAGDFIRVNEQLLDVTYWESPPLRTDINYYFYVEAIDTSGNVSEPSQIFMFSFSNEPDLVTYIPEVKPQIAIPVGRIYEDDLGFSESDFMMRLKLGGNA